MKPDYGEPYTVDGCCCGATCCLDEFGNPITDVISGSGLLVTTSGTWPTTVATSGTGLISATNFLSWSDLGTDLAPSAPAGDLGTTIGGFTTTLGTPITAVTLVENTAPPGAALSYVASGGTPPPTPVTFERRTSPNTFSGDFSAGEPLLFANALDSGILIDFGEDVYGAGCRIQQDGAEYREDFFIIAYRAGVEVFAATDQIVDSTSPGLNNATFYGICREDGFDQLFMGFADGGAGSNFAIGTLEVCAASGDVTYTGMVMEDETTLMLMEDGTTEMLMEL